MLNTSTCWAPGKIDMARLERNKWTMLWMYGLKPDNSIDTRVIRRQSGNIETPTQHSIYVIRTKFDIVDFKTAIHFVRLQWSGRHAGSLSSESMRLLVIEEGAGQGKHDLWWQLKSARPHSRYDKKLGCVEEGCEKPCKVVPADHDQWTDNVNG